MAGTLENPEGRGLCNRGGGSLLLRLDPARLFLSRVSAAFDQAQTVAIYVLPAATGSL